MKILIADKLPSQCIAALGAMGFEVRSQPELDQGTLPAAIVGYHVLIVRSTRVTQETMAAGNQLQLVIRAGAGTNTIDCDGAAKRGVFVANCPGKNAIAVAELTMALILASDRRIADNVISLRAGCWDKKGFSKAQGLFGRTLGVVGLGRTGQAVAIRAQAFGMRVIAWSRSLTVARGHELGVECCHSVQELCAQADVVTIHVAMTQETKHLVGHAELASMKDGALIVNMARGGVVDDGALYEAVSSGRLRAAADVYENEPKGSETVFSSPLGSVDGFYGTHHIGAATEQAQNAVAEEVIRILEHWKIRGEVLNCVNVSEMTDARGQLLVRHLDQVGVLATVLDVLKEAQLNVQEMQNTIFDGGVAACAKITVAQPVNDDLLVRLRGCCEQVLSVEWVLAD